MSRIEPWRAYAAPPDSVRLRTEASPQGRYDGASIKEICHA
jgi:hypothetical protein